MQELKRGDVLAAAGGSITVEKELARGGQGIVYLAQFGGKKYALKWFFEDYIQNEKFIRNIKRNVEKGSPGKAFIWPLLFVEDARGKGYLMELYPDDPNFCEMQRFISGKENGVAFASFNAMINAALNLCEAFRALHLKGLSYQDLNDTNFLFNRETGEVFICDNDNAAPDGEAMVEGYPGFIAPEVISGKAKPSSLTDLYSLAVVLFRLFYIDHPLVGRYVLEKWPISTSNAERIYMGTEPMFVFDPANDKNRPDKFCAPNLVLRWAIYPDVLRRMFTEAFTTGITDPYSRRSVKGWMEELIKTRDRLVRYQAEGKIREQFADFRDRDTLTKLGGIRALAVEGYAVALYPGKAIYKCHTEKGSMDFRTVAGGVIASGKPGVFGLKNVSGKNWEVTRPGEAPRMAADGAAVLLQPGTTINFGGGCVGVIH